MSSILLVLPYFGKWPIWFDAHLLSIEKNPTINWLFVTDCQIPDEYPKNIKFVGTTLQELNEHVNQVVDVDVPLTPRKLCDLKPAYGDIFKEHVLGYDFWGFCDLDIIWGDLREFITDAVLNDYDIISSRKEAISGHFNLFRNTDSLNILYKQVENYKSLFIQPRFMWFDEHVLTNYIISNQLKGNFNYTVYWPTILLNQERGIDSWQGYYLDKWLWKDGKVLELNKQKVVNEVMYLHFISWKSKMRKCQVDFKKYPNMFYISYNVIKEQKHNLLFKKLNDLKNLFYGFWIRENFRVKKKRFKKKLKMVLNRIYER